MNSTRKIFAAVVTLILTGLSGAAEINDRMSLVEAIDSAREQGIEISYSSLLVKPWMRVRSTPQAADSIVALREALQEYSLGLEQAAGDRWLVVQGQAPAYVRRYEIQGRVVDAASGGPLRNARVEVAGITTRSDADGGFRIAGLETEDVDLLVSASGYTTHERRIDNAGGSATLLLELQPAMASPTLEEITIVASRYSVFDNSSTSGQFLSGDEIRLMPHIADDAFRVFHRLPGVAANDFQAPFNLRGGTTEEVKVIFNGLELFEPYHMRTLYSPLSIIDPGVISQAQVLSGGFTADYGNHMSGVVDINSERPAGAPVHQVGVSFVSSFARSSGTFSDNRGAYQVSARRGYLDLIADAVTDDGEELDPRYSDVFASFDYALGDSVDLTANILFAADEVEFVDPGDGEDFGGDSALTYAWLTVDAEPAERVRIATTLFTGYVDTTEDGGLSNLPHEFVTRFFAREVSVSGLHADATWSIGDALMLKFGGQFRDLSADYDYHINSLRQTDIANGGVPYTLVRDIVTSRDGQEFGTYAALRFRTSERMAWELGLRWDKQTYSKTGDDSQVSPRINGVINLTGHTELRFGWGDYYQPQGIQDLQVEDGVTDFFPAQRAEHRIVGVRHRADSGIEAQLDIYEKRYRDLQPRFENVFDTYEFAPESNFDRVRLDPQSAMARGIELTLRKRASTGIDWWMNYTWSKAEDTIDGVSVRRSWDQRHAFTGNLTWRGDKWNISAIARYHSGWPRTPLLLLPVFDAGGNFIGAEDDLSQRNGKEYDAYTRVDLRLSRMVDFTSSNLEYYFEIYNVFNADNQCCVAGHSLTINPTVTASPDVDEYLPFFPSFGFVWTFGPGATNSR